MRATKQNGWPHKRLKYVVQLRHTRVERSDDEQPYIGLEHIESGTGRLVKGTSDLTGGPDKNISANGESLCNTFDSGDVLFGKLRPYLAKAWVAEFSGRCTTELLVMQPSELNSCFLRYVCLSRDFIDTVDASTFGSKMPRADWNFIGNMQIPLPSNTQQCAIADFLDREMAKIDALIEAKERILGILAEKRRALITHAVTRGLNPDTPSRDSGIPWLGKIPTHWAIPPVYARFDVQLGKMLDEKRIKGTHLAPYLRNVDVQWDSVNTEDLPVMDFDEQDRVRYSLKKDDVLVCEGGEIGRCALWQGDINDCYYQKALHRLRPMHKKDEPQFFQFVMRTLVDAGIFSSEALASTIQHLPAEKLRVLRYPSPPIHEQHAIVAYINQETSKLDAMRDATEKTIGLLKERRAALIAATVTGVMNISEQ